MGQPTARRAVAADLEALLPVYASATADEATNAWIMAAGPLPEGSMDGHLRRHLGRAVDEDEVWLAERGGEILGAAVWLRVETAERFLAEAREFTEAAEREGLAALARAATAERVTAERHPESEPHLYLHSIAVLPEHRGSGAGGAILRVRLEVADAEGAPVYLEASTEDSARLYRRFGFEESGPRMRLPEDGPVLIPMWRKPARVRDSVWRQGRTRE